MATVIDRARGAVVSTDAQYDGHNTTFQTGASPTWMKTVDFRGPDTVESAIGFAYETGVDNTADQWTPHIETVFLESTPATTRF